MQPEKLSSMGNLKPVLVRRASRVWIKCGLSKDFVALASFIASFRAASDGLVPVDTTKVVVQLFRNLNQTIR